MSDTIYAPATAAGRAAVAVVRVSGPLAKTTIQSLAGRLPRPRSAQVRTLITPTGQSIDKALVLWFPGPASYTGEDSAEFHVHGGPAVVGALLAALSGHGLRLAEPGEFTRRSFENGKMDLAQAEGVADLIEAETEAQRRQALDQLSGTLGRAHLAWREDLIACLSMFEAAVDFPDEEIPADVAGRAQPILRRLIDQLSKARSGVQRGERIREGYRIALVGAPNAGKSTILNGLAQRDAAIVTAIPGTTRDIIEVHLVLGGYKAVLADTAGLRDTTDQIEAEGVRRALAWAEQADLRIWIVDGAGSEIVPPPACLNSSDICLINKADQPASVQTAHGLEHAAKLSLTVQRLSAHQPTDIAALAKMLTSQIVSALAGGDPPTATRLRHGALLDEALLRLESAYALQDSPELAAEDVRLAARALDRVTGRIDSEDVLDRVFSSFCIGK
jgi:tRNA modification GTPase